MGEEFDAAAFQLSLHQALDGIRNLRGMACETATLIMANDGDDFDENQACVATRTLWLTMAAHLHVTATARASEGEASYLALKEACRIAALADACYWQATGTAETASLADLLKLNGEV